MFAVGFLLVLVLAVVAIHLLTRMFTARERLYVWLFIVAFCVSLPFWHYLYPSYRQFVALCASPDLYVVKKTVEIDYPYYDGGSFGAHLRLRDRGFKGFDIKQYKGGFVRYSRNEAWASPSCQRDCAARYAYEWEKTCEVNCFTRTPIPAPEFETSSSYSTSELVPGRLVERRSAVLAPSGEEIAVNRSYVYYHYGTSGAARMLGLAGGEPPKLSCEPGTSVYDMGFLRPRGAS